MSSKETYTSMKPTHVHPGGTSSEQKMSGEVRPRRCDSREHILSGPGKRVSEVDSEGFRGEVDSEGFRGEVDSEGFRR
eukprot:1166698-Amorphochlora_amoeboformis.AAC.4